MTNQKKKNYNQRWEQQRQDKAALEKWGRAELGRMSDGSQG